MRKPAVFILLVRQVFFIPAQQVKGCGKQIKRKIAGSLKESSMIIRFKTVNLLGMDTGFKKQRGGLNEKLLFRKIMRRVIQLRPGFPLKFACVGSNAYRFVK